MVPEGGMNMVSELVKDGVLVAGDAAGFCLNVGYTVRGMDLAIASGEAAAKAVLMAKEQNSYSQKELSCYQSLLNDSFVIKDMKLYKDLPSFLDNTRFFTDYPQMAANVMHDLFVINGPEKPVRKKILSQVKKVGVMNLIKDGFKGVRSL